jgi:hypothetical protein
VGRSTYVPPHSPPPSVPGGSDPRPRTLRLDEEKVKSVKSIFHSKPQMEYSQIWPNGHLPLAVICVMWPLCFCPSAAHSLLKQSVLNAHLLYGH